MTDPNAAAGAAQQSDRQTQQDQTGDGTRNQGDKNSNSPSTKQGPTD
ncbi:hypothetical protein ACWEVP_11085 [Amycolatopsis sp. NPDC003865]